MKERVPQVKRLEEKRKLKTAFANIFHKLSRSNQRMSHAISEDQQKIQNSQNDKLG